MSLSCPECVGRGYPCPDHHGRPSELPPRRGPEHYDTQAPTVLAAIFLGVVIVAIVVLVVVLSMT